MKPLFIIAGAPKCGTTALWHYLNQHPEVAMSSIKEPRFFTKAESQLARKNVGEGLLYGGTYHRGIDWYESLFTDTPLVKRSGEATTHYLIAEDAPELIYKHFPQSQLIFLFRHPVERVYSHYWQDSKEGLDLPDFPTLVHTQHPRFKHYTNASHYARHLKRFLRYFPKEQLLVLLDQDLKVNPTKTLQQICTFLSIDAHFVPANQEKNYNEHREYRNPWIAQKLARLKAASFKEYLPERLRRSLGKAQRKLMKAGSKVVAYPPLSPELRSSLLPDFIDDVRFLEDFLKQDLSTWFK